MTELALVSLAPLPGVTTLVVVTFTVSGLVLKVTVGAAAVPPTVMTSRALAASPVFDEPQAARNTRGMRTADTTRKRDRRTPRPSIIELWVHPTLTLSAAKVVERTFCSASVNQVHDEDEGLPRLDRATGAAVTVGEMRRDGQLATAADLHADDAVVPALDDLTDAQPEVQRRTAGP